jgi:hypothetical protein
MNGCTLRVFIPPTRCMHCEREREREFGLFVTLCVICNFDADTRVCISKNTFKKPLTKPSLEEPDRWQLELFCPPSAGNPCNSSLYGCARRYPARCIACSCIFGGCARRCSTRRIACSCFLMRLCSQIPGLGFRVQGSGSRVYPPHCLHLPLSRLCFCGCAFRCSTRCIACIRFFGDCAHRCSTRRIPCSCF